MGVNFEREEEFWQEDEEPSRAFFDGNENKILGTLMHMPNKTFATLAEQHHGNEPYIRDLCFKVNGRRIAHGTKFVYGYVKPDRIQDAIKVGFGFPTLVELQFERMWYKS